MNVENPLWGAPRIHGELLKLGFEIAQSSVAKYMVKRRGPPSQEWRNFLRNHAPDIAAIDLFVVPTIGFDLLYAFVIVRLNRFLTSCPEIISVKDNLVSGTVVAELRLAAAQGDLSRLSPLINAIIHANEQLSCSEMTGFRA